jgi:hypothetical protein
MPSPLRLTRNMVAAPGDGAEATPSRKEPRPTGLKGSPIAIRCSYRGIEWEFKGRVARPVRTHAHPACRLGPRLSPAVQAPVPGSGPGVGGRRPNRVVRARRPSSALQRGRKTPAETSEEVIAVLHENTNGSSAMSRERAAAGRVVGGSPGAARAPGGGWRVERGEIGRRSAAGPRRRARRGVIDAPVPPP